MTVTFCSILSDCEIASKHLEVELIDACTLDIIATKKLWFHCKRCGKKSIGLGMPYVFGDPRDRTNFGNWEGWDVEPNISA